MRDYHKEFVYRKIKKPNKFLARIVFFIFGRISRKRNVEFVYDDDFNQIRDKQMILLCQHRSRTDFIYVYAGIRRKDMHIMCGYQNVFQPFVYTILKKLEVIAKMLYQPDMHATMQVLGATKLGDSVMIFPEGIQSTSGSTHPINPATLKLLMKLKLPVGLATLNGAYFTRNRYCSDIKKGKITVRFSKLFDPEDFTNLSKDALYEKLLSAFRYNEFEERPSEKIAYRGKKPNIYGLDNIIYRCPQCGAEYRFEVRDTQMHCLDCGFAVSMDEYYDIAPVQGALPFANIDQWYKWQRHTVAQQVQQDDFCLSTKVQLNTINTHKLSKNFSLLCQGEGLLTLTNKALTYQGTRNGEQVMLTFDPKLVFSLTMSLAYDLDLYYNGEYMNFKLLENEKQVTKWMLCAEEIHNLYDPVWKSVSDEVYNEE